MCSLGSKHHTVRTHLRLLLSLLHLLLLHLLLLLLLHRLPCPP
jgi:hypothetical protein